MKIKFLFMIVVSSLVMSALAMDAAMEEAIRNGAMAKVICRVVDDEGAPVRNATAHVWFSSYGRHQDDADWVIDTDTNGIFVAEHRTNEQLAWIVEKKGYYQTHGKILFRDREVEGPKVADGKWQPYGETRTVVLKRVKHPGKCIPFVRSLRDVKIPKFGVWLGFDLEKGSWVSPWGTGAHEDVLLRLSSREIDVYRDFRYVMEVSFTNNPCGGAYLAKSDFESDLKTAYCANTNGVYQAAFVFYAESIPGKKPSRFVLDESSYLVYRTRTVADGRGKLTSGHYGMIKGSLLFDSTGITFSDGCFNPVPNDPSIEDGRYLRDSDSLRNGRECISQ